MKLRSVQVLRGIAASGVVLMHAHYQASTDPRAPTFTQLGAAGVDLFFVISGFIMATIPRRSAASFMSDRIWRIFPLWWIALLPWILLVPTDWLSRAQMMVLWPVTDLRSVPFLGIRWTLSFELLFYCSVASSIRRGPIVPLALFAASLIASFATHWWVFDFLGNPIIFEFLFGATVARLPRDPRNAPLLAAVAGVIFCIAPLRMFPGEVALDASMSGLRALLWGFPAALLLYAALSVEETLFQRRWLSPLVILGDASYSIYLFHLGAFKAFELPWPVEFIAAVGLGVAAWWLIERPILALRAELRRRSRAGADLSPEPAG